MVGLTATDRYQVSHDSCWQPTRISVGRNDTSSLSNHPGNGIQINPLPPGIFIMRIKLSYITPVLAAAAAAVAIAAAPTAMAAANPAGPGCHKMGADPVCPDTHSTLISTPPGNNQINAAPAPVDVGPQYPYWEGDDYWGGYGRGFGGSGFGGSGFGGHGGHGR
jgi:hypothetical protein